MDSTCAKSESCNKMVTEMKTAASSLIQAAAGRKGAFRHAPDGDRHTKPARRRTFPFDRYISRPAWGRRSRAAWRSTRRFDYRFARRPRLGGTSNFGRGLDLREAAMTAPKSPHNGE